MRIHLHLLSLFLTFSLSAGTGYKNLMHEKLDSYTFDGYLETNLSDFKEFLGVNGTLIANQSRFSELIVNGEARLHECILYGPGKIKGDVAVDHSVLEGPLDVTAKQLVIVRCVIGDIVMNPIGNYDQPQVIKVSRGSVIQGNIVFESKNGQVHLSRDSRILGGVIGGTICPFVE